MSFSSSAARSYKFKNFKNMENQIENSEKKIVKKRVSKKKAFELETVPETENKVYTPEQKVLVMGCLHPELSMSVTSEAKKLGVEVVILEDRVIHDYLEAKNKNQNNDKIGDFLSNVSNRLHAEQQALKLLKILDPTAEIEKVSEKIFTSTDVAKKTNLSHSKARDLFQLFHIFGLITFVKGNYAFKFNFAPKAQTESIQKDVTFMTSELIKDIVRYKASIETHEGVEKGNEKTKALIEEITTNLKLFI